MRALKLTIAFLIVGIFMMTPAFAKSNAISNAGNLFTKGVKKIPSSFSNAGRLLAKSAKATQKPPTVSSKTINLRDSAKKLAHKVINKK